LAEELLGIRRMGSDNAGQSPSPTCWSAVARRPMSLRNLLCRYLTTTASSQGVGANKARSSRGSLFHISSFAVCLSLCGLLLSTSGLSAKDPPPATDKPRAEVKLLTIGNSFADNSCACLPDLAKAGGKKLLLFKANLGGHSLAQHAGYVKAFEADPTEPKNHVYKGRIDPRSGEKKDFSLREALESAPWDIVTIQQVSNQSFKAETFQPFAGELIAYVRKYAPQAEIMVHQTWAYPTDFLEKNKYTIDQATMYTQLKAAYQKLADEAGLRIIPVGDAFQAARALPQPQNLNKPGDKHANTAGEYLGGAVFYEVLFHDSVLENSFVPKGLSAEDAQTLRQIAHETVAKALADKKSLLQPASK